MKKSIFYFAAAMLTMFGCSRSDVNPGGNGGQENPEVKIPINISMSGWTKITDTDYETGDAVGIYAVNYSGEVPGILNRSGNHVDNMRFTNNAGTWNPDNEVYWKDQETKVDFYCYYPYMQSVDVSECTFSVQTDQSSMENYTKSEFLWGKATGISPTENAVPIITDRCMSNILVYVVPGKGFTEETFKDAAISVEICNVMTSAKINLATGSAVAEGPSQTVIPYNAGEYYRAMIVPQTVADGTNIINVYVDGVKYSLSKGAVFEPNRRHRFTVTVNKTSGGIDIGIGGWEDDDEDNGGSAE